VCGVADDGACSSVAACLGGRHGRPVSGRSLPAAYTQTR